MKNIAYTKEYLDHLENIYRHVFTPDCYFGEGLKELKNGVSVFVKDYKGGSENTVYRNDKEIFSFKTVNGNNHYEVFTHQNGHEYLFFRKDLYGYSILDLTTTRDYNYFPAASFPTGETFIWCEIFYNPINNIAAVWGCYWACPYGVILADFSDPLSDSPQVEYYDHIEKDFYYGCGFEFIAWDGTDLILRKGYAETEQEQKVISSDEYSAWFK